MPAAASGATMAAQAQPQPLRASETDDEPAAPHMLPGSAWCVWPLPRRVVLAILGHLMWAVCYADRTNISLAIVPMAAEKGWSSAEQGRILSSFFVGYVTTQLLGGWLSHMYGGKVVLGTAVALWSTATLLTPPAADASLGVLLAARVLMGIGEGMALPTLHHLTGRWVPLHERSRFLAATAVGKFVGTGSAMSCAFLVAQWWPGIFYLFGVLGLLWVVVWAQAASSDPASCRHIGAAERAYLSQTVATFGVPHAAESRARGGEVDTLLLREQDGEAPREAEAAADGDAAAAVPLEAAAGGGKGAAAAAAAANSPPPWGEIVRCRALWAVAAAHFCTLWAQYLLISWLPTYFTQQVGLDLGQSGKRRAPSAALRVGNPTSVGRAGAGAAVPGAADHHASGRDVRRQAHHERQARRPRPQDHVQHHAARARLRLRGVGGRAAALALPGDAALDPRDRLPRVRRLELLGRLRGHLAALRR